MHLRGKSYLSVAVATALIIGCTGCSSAEPVEDVPVQESSVEATAEAEEPQEAAEAAGVNYSITEENGAQEMTMNQQPESSYWFPAQLMEWNAAEDEDLAYNVSTVALAERAPMENLTPVNETQNKDTRIMALSIMNNNTSGNSPHGLNKVGANTFSYWQYVDTLVYWGGSSGEGLIVPPSADVTDMGHTNGVPVIGTIFFPQTAHGGKMEWLDEFLTQDEAGNYVIVDKLIEVAQTYGFDGWFLNQETEGTDEAPLTAEHAAKVQELIGQYKEKAPELEIIYYDSMTVSGEMDWQNALTEENLSFIAAEDGTQVADSMFLNFWWTGERLAGEELLKSSREFAEANNVDPYDLYAGVDIQSNGYNTDIRWNLFENPEGGTYTSLGVYCPSWAYNSASTMQDFWARENKLWVNSKGDPSVTVTATEDTQWKGISTYVVERTAVTSLPFITNFTTGNGYGFYKNGELISNLDWNNRSISDILPTYRYIIEDGEGNKLTADLDVGDAFYGGNSLILRGSVTAGASSTIKLYSTDVALNGGEIFTTTAKAKTETELYAVLTLEDGAELVLEGDTAVGTEWTTVSFDTSAAAGKTVRAISYQMTAKEDNGMYQFRFGNITLAEDTEEALTTVSGLSVDGTEFDEDAMYAGVRMSWETDTDAKYYEVYRVNLDGSKSLLGVSNTTSFYVNTLPRTDDTNKSTFEVVPVTARFAEGTAAQVTMDWPDNSLPKAALTADHTLVQPGQTVTFTSLCSLNTEDVSWNMPGADTETAEGTSVTAVYQEEGIYDVTVIAKNASGEAEKTMEGFIVVTADAADGLALLSLGAGTEADTFVNDNEAPPFAVDGDYTKKWCATGSAPHEITLDLGAVMTVSEVDVYNAEAGGESADMNTKSYAILVSEDGVTFTEVITVTRNTAGVTHDTFAPVQAQYVKLVVNKPTQGSDSAARIYEVEVFGLE